MSSSSGYIPTSTGLVVNATMLVSSVLILYDHLLTFSREVDYVWQCKMTASLAMFYCNRYSALTYSVFGVLGILFWSDYTSCVVISVAPQILMMINQLMWILFSTLRAYIISSHNLYATILVGLLALVAFSCHMFVIVNYRFSRIPSVTGSCSTYFSITQNLNNKSIVVTAECICLIASEMIVLIILVVCTPNTGSILKGSLAARIRRSGFLYFAIMVILNMLDAILFVKGVFYDVFPNFITPLSSIIISRFFLDLREHVDQPTDESRMTTLQFAHTVQEPNLSTEPRLHATGEELQRIDELALEALA